VEYSFHRWKGEKIVHEMPCQTEGRKMEKKKQDLTLTISWAKQSVDKNPVTVTHVLGQGEKVNKLSTQFVLVFPISFHMLEANAVILWSILDSKLLHLKSLIKYYMSSRPPLDPGD